MTRGLGCARRVVMPSHRLVSTFVLISAFAFGALVSPQQAAGAPQRGPGVAHRDENDPRWVWGNVTVEASPADVWARFQQVEAWRRQYKLKYRIEVDGGINFETAAECALAGADTFVSGTGLFRQHSMKAAVTKMRKLVTKNGRHSELNLQTPRTGTVANYNF